MLIALCIFAWIVIGLWLAWKRDWHKEGPHDDNWFWVLATVLFMPIVLIFEFIQVFLYQDWD